MLDAVRRVLEADPRVAYALVFGSVVGGARRLESDVDVAVGLSGQKRPSPFDVGDLVSRLEAVLGCRVDLLILDEASPGLAYRVFRQGRVVVERDRRALTDRRARALLEYLDFRPIEELCARGVLAAAARGR